MDTSRFPAAGHPTSRTPRLAWLAILCLPLLMGTEVYRWVDENGVVNYTQLSPPGTNAQLIRTRPGRPSETIRNVEPGQSVNATDATGAPAEPKLSAEQQRRLQEMQAAERARQEEMARIRSFNCERSRNVLSHLTAGPRIRAVGPDGQSRVIPDDELQRRIAAAQRAIAENCGPA